MLEREFKFNPEDKDFHNEDYRQNVMENGSDEEATALKNFYSKEGLSEKQIENHFYYAKLRRSIIDAGRAQLEERLKINSKPTAEELDLGGYAENIEAQGRSAVFTMRRKGYNTYESGFWANSQKISIEGELLEKYAFGKNFLKKMEEKGVRIRQTKKSIIFDLDDLLNDSEIKEIWDEIADILPDLGHPAEPAQTQTAIQFREKF